MYTSGPVYTKQAYQSTEQLSLLPAAGVSGNRTESAKDALTWSDRPPTPEGLKPFQHYARQPVGTITKHFGSARDPTQQGPFGCKTKVGQQSAADCLSAYPASDIARWRLEKSEDVYERYYVHHHWQHKIHSLPSTLPLTSGADNRHKL